ncbi:phosphoribosyl-ATP diphosphatase [Thalassobaculum sp.]|jgi:phosphoribosyl-ATP pyrophosphohydrolase|uniref:phosphoribosyl-ATP diphosphatase n=1 Tax=Thalassobaculum sp. TaxID=2022740 RepID=UPI003B597B66
MTHPIDQLFEMVQTSRAETKVGDRTAQLLRDGNPKIAKKVVEEAAEVALDAAVSDRDGVIRESADLLYNLTVLWVWMGITPAEIWHEMHQRERDLGLAGKWPK